jgi:LiaI-LiaF-like transmembrane region/B-box zinc finger
MKCATHPDRDATGYCRTCGKPLCPDCTRDVRGALYCEGCLAAMLSGAPVGAPVVAPGVDTPNPALAAALGFIPGLGAIYNGEYMKGLIHIAVFAGIIAMLNAQVSDSLQVFFGIGLGCFYFYMPIEAYRTAKMKRAMAYGFGAYAAPPAPPTAAPGMPAGTVAFTGPAESPYTGAPAAPPQPQGQVQQWPYRGSMTGAVVLIIVGVLILLANMGLLSGDWLGHWWPLILIAGGVWLFWKRFHEPAGTGSQKP